MSLGTRFDREISIIPRTVAEGRDAQGNEIIESGDPIDDVPAFRHLTSATEDTAGRDDQARGYTYTLAPYWSVEDTRTLVELSGYDLLVDGDETYHPVGEPTYVRGRRGVIHHVTVDVERHGPRPPGAPS